MSRFPEPEVWAGRRVLLTGNTGFKGSWLAHWLRALGSDVLGLALPALPTDPSLWQEMHLDVQTVRADLCEPGWEAAVRDFRPEVVFHLAAQSIVAEGYRRPTKTFDTNVVGTARLLESLAGHPDLLSVVVVTTDKVYDPRQQGPFVEGAFLGGADPYAASKAGTELVCASWPDRDLTLVTARAGNVVGGGDWAHDRLVPDLVRAWSDGEPLILRDPSGVRPWQHVLEPLRGYLLYAEELILGAELPPALNFGPSMHDMVSVSELVSHCAGRWAETHSGHTPEWVIAGSRPYSETGTLTIDSRLAAAELGWEGLLPWKETMAMTLDWYLGRSTGQPVAELVRQDLSSYYSAGGQVL
jgi:CDP-glucose 4,6-dehydratase